MGWVVGGGGQVGMWRQGGSRNLIATGANLDVFFVVVFTLCGEQVVG